MAVSTEAYFSNSTVGQMMVGADINIHQVDSSPKFPVGQGFTRADGNKYRYACIGAATSAGQLMSQDISESCNADEDNVIVAPATAQNIDGTNINAGDVGSHYVEITLASQTKDQYAGGYFITTDDTGEGYTYRVRGNTATDTPTSGNFRLELYDPVKVAVDNTTDFSLVGSLYSNLEQNTSRTDCAIAGILQTSVDSAGDFAWVCTHGVTAVKTNSTTSVGGAITPAESTAGSVERQIQGNATQTAGNWISDPVIGWMLDTADSGGHGPAYIVIE
jgi:hypothetical protein